MPSLRKRVSSYFRQLSFHNEPREKRTNINENSFVTKYLQGQVVLKEGPPIIHGKNPTDLPNYDLANYKTGSDTIVGCYTGPNGGLTTIKRKEKHLSVLDPDIDFIDTPDEVEIANDDTSNLSNNTGKPGNNRIDPSLPVDWTKTSDHVFGMSDSLYDRNLVTKRKNGDPIADCFGIVARRDSAVLAVADGVNWGEKACIAAKSAIHASLHYLNSTIFLDSTPFDSLVITDSSSSPTTVSSTPSHDTPSILTTRDVFVCLLRAFHCAHDLILETGGMLTTLTVAVVVPVRGRSGTRERGGGGGDKERGGGGGGDKERGGGGDKYVCCVCNVGDTLAYVYSQEYGVRELTKGSHDINCNRDMRDALGALGPVDGINPELSNLTLSITTVQKGDIILIASDGLTDNFDPNVCKFTVSGNSSTEPVAKPARRNATPPRKIVETKNASERNVELKSASEKIVQQNRIVEQNKIVEQKSERLQKVQESVESKDSVTVRLESVQKCLEDHQNKCKKQVTLADSEKINSVKTETPTKPPRKNFVNKNRDSVASRASRESSISSSTIPDSNPLIAEFLRENSVESQKKSINSVEFQQKSINSVEVQQKSINSVEFQQKSSNSVESQQKERNFVEFQQKQRNSVEFQEKSINSVESQQKSTNSVEFQQKPTNSVESQKKQRNSVEFPQKQTNYVEFQQKPTNSVEFQDKSTNSVESQQKQRNSVEFQQKSTNSVDFQQKQRNSIESQPKQTNYVEFQEKPTNSVEFQQKSTNLVESQQKSSNFVDGNQKSTNPVQKSSSMRVVPKPSTSSVQKSTSMRHVVKPPSKNHPPKEPKYNFLRSKTLIDFRPNPKTPTIKLPPVSRNPDGIPFVTPVQRYELTLLLMEDILRRGITGSERQCVTARRLCENLLSFTVSITSAKRKTLEDSDLYYGQSTAAAGILVELSGHEKKTRRKRALEKVQHLPGKLDHVTVVGCNVGLC